MSAIRAALCDDEQAWLDCAEQSLGAFARCSGIDISVEGFADGTSLLEGCTQVPDVLFCDVEIGSDENGIDLVQSVKRAWPSCQVVYVTNFLRYAPDVYVTEHLWFVLKDTFEERLPEIMSKLVRQMADGSRALAVETVSHELLALPCTCIASLERKGRVTIISRDDGSKYQVSDRLPALLDRLPRQLFAQCHGSFAVGLGHVRLVRRDGIVLDDGTQIPLSRRFARGFRERYLDWVEDHAL